MRNIPVVTKKPGGVIPLPKTNLAAVFNFLN